MSAHHHENAPILVIPDLHGHSSPLEKVVKEYGENVEYVTIGDSIGGGPDSAGVLDIIKAMKMRLGMGNWEMYTAAGLLYYDLEQRGLIQRTTKPFDTKCGTLQDFAKSYGVATNQSRTEMIQDVTVEMQKRGHLDMLARAAMFTETEQFIGIHAGLTNEPWEKQKQDLAAARGTFEELPQIVNTPGTCSLAHQQEAFSATNKIVITGHAHLRRGARVTASGMRVRLASRLDLGDSLYVWQSWDAKVKEIK